MPVSAGPVGVVEGSIPHGLAAFEGVFVSRHNHIFGSEEVFAVNSLILLYVEKSLSSEMMLIV